MLQLSSQTLCKINNCPFGQKIQDYKISNVIGKGGFSVVYEATCRTTSAKVAIKTIKKSKILEEGLSERINQEVNIQAELDHPSILKLFTAFENVDCIYIVLELCSKGELYEYISQDGYIHNSFEMEGGVKKIMKQIVDGLHYLHKRKILHRDLKLHNILLTENMQIKIADFGMATRMLHPNDQHVTMCGTPNYISPEIISHEPHGLEVDLWSLGCILYTLLVGKPPFETESRSKTFSRVIYGDYKIPPHLSYEAKDLINRLLQKDPHSRIKLDKICNHPFISDDRILTNQTKISGDSGIDSVGTLDSNCISSKFHSLDRKQHSNNSNGYYSFETPTSSRRCRSQDRKKIESKRFQFPSEEMVEILANPVLFSDNNSNSRRDYSHEVLKNNILENGNDLYSSDIMRYTPDMNVKPSCELFCENEILNRRECYCSKCNYIVKSYSNENHLASPQKINFREMDYLPSYPRNEFKKHDVRKNANVCVCVKNFENEKHIREIQNDYNSSDPDSIKVIPFNTERLKPTRCKCKNVILSLLENGEVCVEFLRNSSKLKEIVVEVCRISKDGLQMYIYYPNERRGIPPSDSPPSLPLNGSNVEIFECKTLSRENFKKYTYAIRFVEMVQSKTPKITLYTNKAKCVLMENKPEADFEITYYEGSKITKSRKGIKLIDNGKVVSILNDTGQKSLHPYLLEHYTYFQQCYNYCRLIEEKLASTCTPGSETIFRVFPAMLGKKPMVREKNIIWDGCTGSPNFFHSTKYNA